MAMPRKSNAGRKKRILSDPVKGKPEKVAKLELKSDEQKNEEQKNEEQKSEQLEESKPEEPKSEEAKNEESKDEDPKNEEPKAEEQKEEPKAEEQKKEEPMPALEEEVAKDSEMSSLGELAVKIKQKILSPEQEDDEPQDDPLNEPLDGPMNLLLDQLLDQPQPQPQDPGQDEPLAQPLIEFPDEELQVVPLVEFPDDEPLNEVSPDASSLTPTPENALALVGPVADLRNIPVATWTVDQVVGFVGRHYPREASAFRFQDIDGASLLLLTRNDVMNGFGLKLGQALRVFELVMCLQNGNDDVRLAWFE